jgi:predicted RNA methylase
MAFSAASPTRMTDPALVDRHIWLAGLLNPAPGERVVDLGCGEGVVLKLVLTRLDGGAAVGVDRDVEALRALTSVPGPGARARLVAAALADPLPLADRSVDADLVDLES